MLQFLASPLGTRNSDGEPAPEGYFLLQNALSPGYGGPYGDNLADRVFGRAASSTADYYHMDGLYDFAPYDLRTMGAWGASMETAHGYRYVWFIGCDHPGQSSGYEGGWGFDAESIYAAFSNDPAIMPDPGTMFRILNADVDVVTVSSGNGNHLTIFTLCFVYNPDDVTNPAYLYTEGYDQSGGSNAGALVEIIHTAPDLSTEFVSQRVSHPSAGGTNTITGYQRIYRLGTGNWESYGQNYTASYGGTISLGKWTSTDGQSFTKVGSGANVGINHNVGGSLWSAVGASFKTTIAGQTYKICKEAVTSGAIGASQYITLVAVNSSTGDILLTPAPTRLAGPYINDFPGVNFIQTVPGYEEDGIYFAYSLRGMFGDVGTTREVPSTRAVNELPEDGGGINEQYVDILYYITNATAAADAAPCGVRASCVDGVVTIAWHDVPAGRTYRVARGTDSTTQGTAIGDVVGSSTTNTPTPGSVYYYRVTALNAGTPAGYRIVSTYAS